MFNLVLFVLIFGPLPFFLHELGHWLALKYYAIPFKVEIRWYLLLFSFKIADGDANLNSVKVGLAGGVLPLLILVPCWILGLGLMCYSVYALWTIWETWLVVRAMQEKYELKLIRS
jgi:hypothetical protein